MRTQNFWQSLGPRAQVALGVGAGVLLIAAVAAGVLATIEPGGPRSTSRGSATVPRAAQRPAARTSAGQRGKTGGATVAQPAPRDGGQ
jgi:hypothetical protein